MTAKRGRQTFAIVGAGQAGAWVARTLRAEGFAGRLVLIGAETHPPYERPSLSKGLLTATSTLADATLLDRDGCDERGIELWAPTAVGRIDRAGRRLLCADGRVLDYDVLFLTTGARPLRLPIAGDATGRVHILRTIDDALRLRRALTESRSLLVIGGGWIGLEVAATARSLGLSVTLLEGGDRLCARSVPGPVSDYLADLHVSHGVDLRLSASVDAIDAKADRVTIRVREQTFSADQLVVGIGVQPEIGLAIERGLATADGIRVDRQGRTSDPAIFAAGDATCQPGASGAAAGRRESWANAQNQAIVAAKASLGQDVVHDELPWFWSDQFGLNMQILGWPEYASRLVRKSGAVADRFCWLGLDIEGRAIGAVAINDPRGLRAARQAIRLGAAPDPLAWGAH